MSKGIFVLKDVLTGALQWPCPRDGRLDRLTFEESVIVNESTTRLQMGMLAAESFCKFFEVRTRYIFEL